MKQLAELVALFLIAALAVMLTHPVTSDPLPTKDTDKIEKTDKIEDQRLTGPVPLPRPDPRK